MLEGQRWGGGAATVYLVLLPSCLRGSMVHECQQHCNDVPCHCGCRPQDSKPAAACKPAAAAAACKLTVPAEVMLQLLKTVWGTASMSLNTDSMNREHCLRVCRGGGRHRGCCVVSVCCCWVTPATSATSTVVMLPACAAAGLPLQPGQAGLHASAQQSTA